MRRILPFLLFLVLLAALSGWLMSRMSWIGRVGVNLFHREYKFLKVWYTGAAAVLGTWLALLLIQWLLDKKLRRGKAVLVHVLAIITALAGIWLTYNDFRTDFSHSILRERFHIGAYLFWLGWISISIFLLSTRPGSKSTSELQVKRG